jgi:short subunit fatty acids transporter
MEVILGEFTTLYFGNVVVCAVTASIVARQFLGVTPAFAVPSYTLLSVWELPLYAILGVLSALPDDCILISVRRGSRVLIPHGNTVFQPGDHITAFIRTRDSEMLHHCLRGAAAPADGAA